MKRFIIITILSLISILSIISCAPTKISSPEREVYGTYEYWQRRLSECQSEIERLNAMPEPTFPKAIKICGGYYKKVCFDSILYTEYKYTWIDGYKPTRKEIEDALDGKRIGLHSYYDETQHCDYIELYDRLDSEASSMDYYKSKIAEIEAAWAEAEEIKVNAVEL